MAVVRSGIVQKAFVALCFRYGITMRNQDLADRGSETPRLSEFGSACAGAPLKATTPLREAHTHEGSSLVKSRPRSIDVYSQRVARCIDGVVDDSCWLATTYQDLMAACIVAASKESHEVNVPLVISSYDRGTGLTNLSNIHHTFLAGH